MNDERCINDDTLYRLDFDYEYVKHRLENAARDDKEWTIFQRFLNTTLATMQVARAALLMRDTLNEDEALCMALYGEYVQSKAVADARNRLDDALRGKEEPPKE